jgi:uncharacterized membrane protein
MQTWTFVRFLHIAGIAFFVGGQLVLATVVLPVLLGRGDEQAIRSVARRLGLGSAAALALVFGSGIALASHFQLWSSNVLQGKLVLLGLVVALMVLQLLTPGSRALAYAAGAGALLVVWLGVKLTYG